MNAILRKYRVFVSSLVFTVAIAGMSAPAVAQLPAGVPGLALPFGVDPMAIGGVGLDLLSGIAIEDGLGAVPLIGADLEIMGSPEGAMAALLALASEQKLPIGLPVIGRKPQKLYGSVIFALLGTYGVPVDGIALPELGATTDTLSAFPIPMP